MALTVAQLHEIRRIIESHHQAFIVNALGADAVAPEVLKKLKDLGLINVQISTVKDAYLYGQAVAAATDPKVAKMGYEDFRAWLKKNPIPLSDMEKRAIDFAKQQAAQYVVGLGNRVNTQTGQLMIEADAALRAETRKRIKDSTAENIATRQTVKKLKSNLGWAAKDWARDWDRIAITEKHTAMQRGVADHYHDLHGPETKVAKRPTPDACKHCKRLHLGPDGHPRIFKLSTLEANGLNNFGRKAADWLPVIGSTHPYCQCQLIRIPAGWGFNADGELDPEGEFGIEYDDEVDVLKAMRQEDALLKAFALQDRIEFQGLDICIENTAGSTRRWTDDEGNTGETTMQYAYGYIANTRGADEDEIDVFVGPDPRATRVYVINQQNPKTGRYDEDKCMVGFPSEEHARFAYQTHYNRNDFLITINAMDLDHFKRWISVTSDTPLLKHGKPAEQFLIPLQKSGLKTVEGSLNENLGATGMAIARSPSPGTATNFFVNTTPKKAVSVGKEFRDIHREFLDDTDHRKDAVKRDKEDYIFNAPEDRRSLRYKLELPEGNPANRKEEMETNRFILNAKIKEKKKPPKNKADVEKSKKPDTPIGGITPGGYLKVGKGQYIDPKKGTPHAKKKKPPPKKKPDHIVSGTFARKGDIQILQPKDMQGPNVYDGYLQRGAAIQVLKNGKPHSTGVLLGLNPQGRPVVNVNGENKTYHWPPKEGEPPPPKVVIGAGKPQKYRATYEHLGEKALVKATKRQMDLVKSVLQLEVSEGKPAKEYLDSLRKIGNEVHLVGGIVRDLVAGTSPDSNMTDDQVKQKMYDIDFVSTAHPGIGSKLAEGAKKTKDSSGYGVFQILDGVGLDISSIASRDSGSDYGQFVGDHDLNDDCQRRDFTANCLFYDVYNDAIIDPTGNGYADAQQKILRLAPKPKNAMKNLSLPIRFWKFRMRGWKAEEQTLAFIRKLVPQVPSYKMRDELKKNFKKMKGSKKDNWEKFKQAMIEDNCYDLYKKYFEGHRSDVVGWS